MLGSMEYSYYDLNACLTVVSFVSQTITVNELEINSKSREYIFSFSPLAKLENSKAKLHDRILCRSYRPGENGILTVLLKSGTMNSHRSQS
jgi:hypothetical protein